MWTAQLAHQDRASVRRLIALLSHATTAVIQTDVRYEFFEEWADLSSDVQLFSTGSQLGRWASGVIV
jgi:hypothetical protein